MRKTVMIPERFYENGKPYITDYLKQEGQGLAYYLSHEQRIDYLQGTGVDADIGVVSLLSPYILGFDFGYSANELELDDVDLDTRTVIVQTKS